MKKWISIIVFTITICKVNAQNANQTSDLRFLTFDEWSSKYSTIDEKGKILNAVSICELNVNAKRCLENPVEVSLNANSKLDYKNLLWCQWDIQKKCWVKISIAHFKPIKNKKSGKYSVAINCPGVYGFLFPDEKLNTGLKIKAPLGCKITAVQMTQRNPDISLNKSYPDPTKQVIIPITELQFAGHIDVTVQDRNGKIFNLKNNLIGSHIELRNGFEKNDVAQIKISKNELLEKQNLSNIYSYEK